MNTLNWKKTTDEVRRATGAVLTAENNGAAISLHLDDRDGEVRPTITVTIGRESFSTDDTQDWPMVEQYVPRTNWPEGIYVGQRGPKERTPDTAIIEAIEEYRAEFADAEDDD